MRVDLKQLESFARTVRRDSLEMIHLAGSGHPGGSLSVTDILVVLYGAVMKYDPQNPAWPGRDRFILSKGHSCPPLYSVLARKGFFPVEELKTLRQFNSRLQGHPDSKRLPGIEISTGSLGQGLSVGVGMALSFKITHQPNKTYVVLGDGECDEGQVWEAALSAAHYKLSNLTAIVDWNKVQLDGTTDEVMNLGDLEAKWASFGWETRVVDGHNLAQLYEAITAEHSSDKPLVVLAKTVKGKGVSFMEGKYQWHGKAPTRAELDAALREIGF